MNKKLVNTDKRAEKKRTRNRLTYIFLGFFVLTVCTTIITNIVLFNTVTKKALAANSTINVTTNVIEEPVANNGNCSLAEAIISANTDTAKDSCTAGSGSDTIVLPSFANFNFTKKTVFISPTSEFAYHRNDALPVIYTDVTIEGNNSTLKRTGSNYFRLLSVDNGGVLSLKNLTIDGFNPGNETGGAIATWVSTILNTDNVIFTNNGLQGNYNWGYGGGAISCYQNNVPQQITANLNINNTSFTNNDKQYGGAIVTETGCKGVINNSIFANNSTLTYFGGGAIAAASNMIISNSTFINNKTTTFDTNSTYAYGGAISSSKLQSTSTNQGQAPTRVINSTFIGNIANYGGAVGGDNVVIVNSTFKDNIARAQGNTFNGYNDGVGIEIKNSIIQSTGNACANKIKGSGKNFVTDASCANANADTATNFTNATVDQLKLGGVVTDGRLQVLPLQTGSVAIDSVVTADCTDYNGNNLTTDQLGNSRPNGAKCDAGAFETNQTSNLGNPTTVVTGNIGDAFPTINLSGNTLANDTAATFTPAGSTTQVTGTIQGGNFVPNSGQNIPDNASTGTANGVLSSQGVPNLNIPTKFTTKATAAQLNTAIDCAPDSVAPNANVICAGQLPANVTAPSLTIKVGPNGTAATCNTLSDGTISGCTASVGNSNGTFDILASTSNVINAVIDSVVVANGDTSGGGNNGGGNTNGGGGNTTTTPTTLTENDLNTLTFTCSQFVYANSMTTCNGNLPANKQLGGNTLKISIGNTNRLSDSCIVNGVNFTCTNVPVGSISGSQPIFAKINAGGLIDTGKKVTVSNLVTSSGNDTLIRTGGMSFILSMLSIGGGYLIYRFYTKSTNKFSEKQVKLK